MNRFPATYIKKETASFETVSFCAVGIRIIELSWRDFVPLRRSADGSRSGMNKKPRGKSRVPSGTGLNLNYLWHP